MFSSCFLQGKTCVLAHIDKSFAKCLLSEVLQRSLSTELHIVTTGVANTTSFFSSLTVNFSHLVARLDPKIAEYVNIHFWLRWIMHIIILVSVYLSCTVDLTSIVPIILTLYYIQYILSMTHLFKANRKIRDWPFITSQEGVVGALVFWVVF